MTKKVRIRIAQIGTLCAIGAYVASIAAPMKWG
jgi:hypothetical protein